MVFPSVHSARYGLNTDSNTTMVTRVSFDPSAASFIDHEDLAFSANQAAAPAAPPAPLRRVHTGAVRFTNGGEEVHHIASGSYSAPITGNAGDSVASTYRSGVTPSVELKPGDPTTRTSVESAKAMGYIVRDEAGNWVDVGSADQQASAFEKQTQEPPPEQQQAPQDVFDHAEAVAFADAIAPVPQHAFDVAQAHVLAGIFEGQTLSQAVAEVGHRLAMNAGGMESAQASAVVQQGIALYHSAAAKAIALEGIGPERLEAFYASIREGNQGPLQDALQRLVYQNDTSGFRALARSWSNTNPGPEVALLKSAGFEVARSSDGGHLARPSGSTGNWVPVADLMKHGSTPAPAAPAAPPQAPAQPAAQKKGYWKGTGPYRVFIDPNAPAEEWI